MPSDHQILREVAVAWRMTLLIGVAQVVGGLSFVALGWPRAVSFAPEVPTALLQFMLGSLLFTPVGFVPGFLWQRASGVQAPQRAVVNAAVASVVLPVTAIIMIVAP
jgi:hypothetical protein